MTSGEALDMLTWAFLEIKRALLASDGRLTDEDLIRLEKQVRGEWGGDQQYVGKRLATHRRYHRHSAGP